MTKAVCVCVCVFHVCVAKQSKGGLCMNTTNATCPSITNPKMDQRIRIKIESCCLTDWLSVTPLALIFFALSVFVCPHKTCALYWTEGHRMRQQRVTMLLYLT